MYGVGFRLQCCSSDAPYLHFLSNARYTADDCVENGGSEREYISNESKVPSGNTLR